MIQTLMPLFWYFGFSSIHKYMHIYISKDWDIIILSFNNEHTYTRMVSNKKNTYIILYLYLSKTHTHEYLTNYILPTLYCFLLSCLNIKLSCSYVTKLQIFICLRCSFLCVVNCEMTL